MPEFAEIATYREELKGLIGSNLISLETENSIRYPAIALNGKLEKIDQFGKVLFLTFSNNKKVLSLHLGMTGQLLGEKLDKGFLRAVFIFEGNKKIFFYDTRKFGYVKIVTKEFRDSSLGKGDIGSISYQNQAIHRLTMRNKAIYSLLLDQNVSRGVGAYLAQEALFRAKISPEKKFLNSNQARAVILALRSVVKLAIKSKGASFKDYRRFNGEKGKMQDHFNVYGRFGEPCIVCDTLLSRVSINGRNAVFCLKCQI